MSLKKSHEVSLWLGKYSGGYCSSFEGKKELQWHWAKENTCEFEGLLTTVFDNVEHILSY